MSESERVYLRHRSAEEREIARSAADPITAAVHDQLADIYCVRSNLTDEELIALEDKDLWTRESVVDGDNSRRTRQS